VMKNGVYPFFCSFLTEVSSRPERSAVEGPAAHPSALPSSPSQSSKPKQRCHPDRSVAQWRDLQFCRPLLEMFFNVQLPRN
jgi:hypothetical protein